MTSDTSYGAAMLGMPYEEGAEQSVATTTPPPIKDIDAIPFVDPKVAEVTPRDRGPAYEVDTELGINIPSPDLAIPTESGAREAAKQAFRDARDLRMNEKASALQGAFNPEGSEVSTILNNKAVTGQSRFYLADTDEQYLNALESIFGEDNVRMIKDDGPKLSLFDSSRFISVKREDGTFTDFEPTTVTFSDYARRVAPGLLAEVGASSAVVGTALLTSAGVSAATGPFAPITGPISFVYMLYAGGKGVETGRQYLQDELGLNEQEAVEFSNALEAANKILVPQIEGVTTDKRTPAESQREMAGILEMAFAAVPGLADKMKLALGRARASGKLKPTTFKSAVQAQETIEDTLPGGSMDIGVPLESIMLQQATSNKIVGRLASLSEQTSIQIPNKVKQQIQSAVTYLQKYGDDVGEGNFAEYQQAVAGLSQTLRSVINRPDSVKNLTEIGEDLGSLEDLFLRLRAIESRGMYNNVFDRLSNASYDLDAIRTTMPGKKSVLPTTDAAAQKGEKVAGALPTQERGEGIIDNLTTDLLSIGRVQPDGSRVITPAQVKAAVRDFAEKNPEYTFDVNTIDSPAKLLQLYASRYGQLARDQFGEFGATKNLKMYGQAMRMRNDLLELIGNPREEIADIDKIRSDLVDANKFYKETDELTSQRLQVQARQGRRSDVKDEPANLAEAVSTVPGGGQRVAPAVKTLENIQAQEAYVRNFLSDEENVAKLSGTTLEMAQGPAKEALTELRLAFADAFASKLARAIPTDPADVTQAGDVVKFLDSFDPPQLRLLGIDEQMENQIRNDATLIASLQRGGVTEQVIKMTGRERMSDIFSRILNMQQDDMLVGFSELTAPMRRAGINADKSKELSNNLRGGLLNYIISTDSGVLKPITKNSAFGEVGDLTIDVAKFTDIVTKLRNSGQFGKTGILNEQDEKMLDALTQYAGVINTAGADAGSALAGAQIIGEMFTVDPGKFIAGIARLGTQARIAKLFANDEFVKAVTGTGKPMSTAEKLRTMFFGKGAFGSIIADIAMSEQRVNESTEEQTQRMLDSSSNYGRDMLN